MHWSDPRCEQSNLEINVSQRRRRGRNCIVSKLTWIFKTSSSILQRNWVRRVVFSGFICFERRSLRKSVCSLVFLLGFDKTLTPGQLTPYWPLTDPVYWPPIKSMGKWKLKNPELSMGPDSSSSINLAYLKLPRWRSRCRFPTPNSFDWRICHRKSSTE